MHGYTAEPQCGGILLTIQPRQRELASIHSKAKCYFRFRLITDFESASDVFTQSRTLASFLYSETEIKERISIRINNPRDVSEQLNELLELEAGQSCFCSLQSVRLFVVASAANQVAN